MTSAEWQKLVYGLTAGWVLAQLTTFVVWRFKAWRIKKILNEELVDVHAQTHRVLIGIARDLQAWGANVLEPGATIPISDPIFKAHYKDAVLHLSSEKRLLYQLIHGHVDKLNEHLDLKDKINASAWKEFQESQETGSFAIQMIEYKKLLKGCYVQCWILDFHIRAQMESQVPTLKFGDPHHQKYLEMLEKAGDKADEFIEAGRSMDPSTFEGAGKFSVE